MTKPPAKNAHVAKTLDILAKLVQRRKRGRSPGPSARQDSASKARAECATCRRWCDRAASDRQGCPGEEVTWDLHHTRSERLAADAQELARKGDREGAAKLYARAAKHETKALAEAVSLSPRTYGITAVSAAALWYKAGMINELESVALNALVAPDVPGFARLQLQDLLQAAWSTRAVLAAGVKFAPGDVLVSVQAELPEARPAQGEPQVPPDPTREFPLEGPRRANMQFMKTLSVRNPWAWAIAQGHKAIENRSWSTGYRGPLAIHASKTFDRAALNEIVERHGLVPPVDATAGAIVCVVDLVDVVQRSRSRWFTGPFGWILRNPRPIQPIAIRGRLGLFEVPIET